MRCPYCNHQEDKVVDSRSCREGMAIRRRRECLNCNKRFTTHCKSMRNLEFFKSKNTNSQARCKSEDLLAENAASANSHPSSVKTEGPRC